MNLNYIQIIYSFCKENIQRVLVDLYFLKSVFQKKDVEISADKISKAIEYNDGIVKVIDEQFLELFAADELISWEDAFADLGITYRTDLTQLPDVGHLTIK
jgi:hypothetical protein